jgi:hypothetical protein
MFVEFFHVRIRIPSPLIDIGPCDNIPVAAFPRALEQFVKAMRLRQVYPSTRLNTQWTFRKYTAGEIVTNITAELSHRFVVDSSDGVGAVASISIGSPPFMGDMVVNTTRP